MGKLFNKINKGFSRLFRVLLFILSAFLIIYFFPKREADLVFEGSFIVTEDFFAVNEISMKVNSNINLNNRY